MSLHIKDSSTVGEYLLNSLEARGVKHIFGIPGDYVLRFDQLIEQHTIKFINTTRENTAGYMADAYARIRGLGAACITYGVGINITNALSQAFVENSPMIVISGSAGTDDYLRGEKLHHLIHKSSKKHLDRTQLEIFKHVTIDQAVLEDPQLAATLIDRVLDNCQYYKQPGYIEIPRNMVDRPISPHHYQPLQKPKTDQKNLNEALKEISEMLNGSKKPVIWIGHEIQRYGLSDDVVQFAEKYHIPIVSSLLGKSAISEYHPLFVGVYIGQLSRPEVSEFINSCDCVLLLGVLLSDVDTGIFTAKLDQEQKVIATSDVIRVKNHQYININFDDFIKGISEIPLNTPFKHSFPTTADRKLIPFTPQKNAKTTTQRTFECIQSHLKPEYIVVTDIGDCLFGSTDLTLDKNSFFACAYFATLGFGTPGAIAAQIAEPNRRVIAIVGDGAFQMTSMELSTAVRYGLDPIIIVLNNHGYGTERPILEGNYNNILSWNYTQIPKVLGGGIGIKAETEEQLHQALDKALTTRGTFFLIEVELGKTDFSAALNRFGKLLSKSEKS